MSNIVTTARKPRWIAAIVAGLLTAALCVTLGMWQFDRLSERRDRNATITARSQELPRPLAGVRSNFNDDPSELAFRHVATEGTYRWDEEFRSVGRVYGDVKGDLVATPLELADGDILIVVRGIVPTGTEGPPMVGYEVPRTPVYVEGRIALGEEPSRIGESDPADGDLTQLSRVDLAFIDEWVDGDVLPFMLLLDTQRPSGPGEDPIPIPNEELSEGNHLGYAVQWFAFALIALVGTATLIVRASRNETASGPEPARVER